MQLPSPHLRFASIEHLVIIRISEGERGFEQSCHQSLLSRPAAQKRNSTDLGEARGELFRVEDAIIASLSQKLGLQLAQRRQIDGGAQICEHGYLVMHRQSSW